MREVSHGGSTAGYQTFLARWPDERLSVAVMCNTTGTNPSGYAHQVADLFLGDKLSPRPSMSVVEVSADALKKLTGVYRELKSDAIIRVTFDEKAKGLRVGGTAVVPTGPDVFVAPEGGRTFTVGGGAAGGLRRITESDGRSRPRVWDAQPPFAPAAAQLAEFAGEYLLVRNCRSPTRSTSKATR